MSSLFAKYSEQNCWYFILPMSCGLVEREREREREIEWFVGLADCNERFQAFDLVMSWWVFQPILWLVK